MAFLTSRSEITGTFAEIELLGGFPPRFVGSATASNSQRSSFANVSDACRDCPNQQHRYLTATMYEDYAVSWLIHGGIAAVFALAIGAVGIVTCVRGRRHADTAR